jgi:hypothetical protein
LLEIIDFKEEAEKDITNFFQNVEQDLFKNFYNKKKSFFSLNREKEKSALAEKFDNILKSKENKEIGKLFKKYYSKDIESTKLKLIDFLLKLINNYKNELKI